jgi:hypothetical protein
MLNDRDSISRRGEKGFFSSTLHPNRLPDPPILLSIGCMGLFSSEVKRPGREADHSPPSSVEAKNAWNYTSTPPYVFMTWYSITQYVFVAWYLRGSFAKFVDWQQ